MRVFLFLTALAFLLNGSSAAAREYSSFMESHQDIKIETNKDVFQVAEAIDGKVKIGNSHPGSSSTYMIKLFQDGKEVTSVVTSTQHVSFGETAFSFKSFGIPVFNKDPQSVGNWRIVIYQAGTDESKAAVLEIKITAPS